MDERQWYALYTRSRHEKFIRSELEKRKIEAFLPLKTIKRRWSDRTVSIQEPLFKSYLFVKVDMACTTEVLKTKGAVRFICAGSKPIAIRGAVIDSIRQAIEQEIQIDPFPYLHEGDRVYVRSGVFAGTEGFIIRKNEKKCRIVISIDAIMSSISFEVDASLVEKI